MQQLLRLNSCRLATLSLLMCFFGFVLSTDASLHQCEKRRPHSSMPTCHGESVRRFFLHPTKGCKKFGICNEDALFYDNQTDNNYFLTWGDCQRTCMESIECPQVEAPMNGVIESDEFFGWGGSIYYSCHVGFSLVGSEKRTCQRNKTWTGDSAPYCQAQCKRPPAVANVKSIAPVQEYYNVGTVIYYTCADEFTGDSQRMCTDDGTWSGQDAECVQMPRQCHEPSPIDYGQVTGPDYSVGAYLSYSCEPGFILAGNTTRRCGEDKQWEGEEPICWKLGLKETHQGSTRDVTNKTVSHPSGTRNIKIALYSTNDIHHDAFESSNIEWSFMDSHGSSEWPNGVNDNDNYIEFTNILGTSREQEGTYTARVANFSVYFTFKIIQGDPPISTEPPTFLASIVQGNPEVGNATTLVCLFRGCPVPDVTWYKKELQDEPVQLNDRINFMNIITHTITISELKIKAIILDDAGYYTCTGGNGFGNVNSTIHLEVLESEITESSPSLSPSSSKLEKRSVRRDERSTLCSSPSEPSTVTIVGRVQRNFRMRRSPHVTSYQIRVDRILNGATDSLKRDQNLKTIIVDSSVEYPERLKRNSNYILKGNVVEDMFLVSGYEFVESHTNELESSLLQC